MLTSNEGESGNQYTIEVSEFPEHESEKFKPQILEEQNLKYNLGIKAYNKKLFPINNSKNNFQQSKPKTFYRISELKTHSSYQIAELITSNSEVYFNYEKEFKKFKDIKKRHRHSPCCDIF